MLIKASDLTNELKLDIDSHKFSSWLRLFEFRYNFLKEHRRLIVFNGLVNRTKKGFHIYLKTTVLDFSSVLFLESLFGSDLNKQMYGYAEWHDILFRNKFNGQSVEKFDKKRTQELNKVIRKINKRKRFVKVYKVKV